MEALMFIINSSQAIQNDIRGIYTISHLRDFEEKLDFSLWILSPSRGISKNI